jgi:hypothetical protein
MAAAGLGADYWFTARLGASIRYEAGYYAPAVEAVSDPASAEDVKQLFAVEARARQPIPLAGVPLAVGARLGASVQDHPAFERQGDALVYTTDHPLPLWLAGIDVQAFPGEHVEAWLGYGIGLHMLRLGQVSQRLELGGLYRLTSRLSLGLSGELWQRHLTATRRSDGVEIATLHDLWAQLLACAMFHF